MDPRLIDVMRDCTTGSDEERLSFPEVVGRLMQSGVESYHADLRRAEKTYYLANNESHVVATHRITEMPARDFSADDVAAAVRAIQARAIGYATFCNRIAAAGCVAYIVSLIGRRAVYYGRSGESYVEPFPPAAARP